MFDSPQTAVTPEPKAGRITDLPAIIQDAATLHLLQQGAPAESVLVEVSIPR